MKKVLIIIVFMVVYGYPTFSQSKAPTSSPSIKAFNLTPDQLGSVNNSVNLFSGDLNLPINLISLAGRNGLDVNVDISYTSNVQDQVDTWNLDAPTGILGLGWHLDRPKIIADTKQTGARDDDTYYLVENGISNQLIRTTYGTDITGQYYVYEAKGYQFWKIKFYYDLFDQIGQYPTGQNKWEITKENGFRFIYGDNLSGRNTLQYAVRWDNWIGSSSRIGGQSRLVIAWNLSEVVNLQGERILFEYDSEEQFVGSYAGQKHTEASYLKQITDVCGRKIKFYYLLKDAVYFMEPHTEQVEPDAYQEVYERKYLDRIEIFSEQAQKQSSINFRYSSINTGTNRAKMLLTCIEQRNASNNSIPGVTFEYYQTTDTNGHKGFLQKVVYPTGGVTTFTYLMTNNLIGHSQRDINITAPPSDYDGPYGYSEPQIWHSEDYVVIAWRALGVGGAHNSGPAAVKLFVYQWVGEWKGQFLQSIYNVSANTFLGGLQYNDFQVVLEKNFFAVLSRPINNTYHLFLRYKDLQNRGNWLDYSSSNYDLGDGKPTLMSGENFIAIGSFWDNTNQPSHILTLIGNDWREEVMDQPTNQHNYSYANNFFISHEQNSSSSLITYNFLSEDKKWFKRNLPLNLSYTSDDPSKWYASNSYAVAMADNNEEFIYRWDLTKSNFYRDNSFLGIWSDASYVFNVDNSLIGIIDGSTIPVKGVAARFDGGSWVPTNYFGKYVSSVSFGRDYLLNAQGGQDTFSNESRFYNPNTMSWTTNYLPPNSNQNMYNSYTFANYFFFTYGGRQYFKTPNGQWNNIGELGGLAGLKYIQDDIANVYFIKNGSIVNSGDSRTINNYIINEPFVLYFDQFQNFNGRDLNSPYTIVGITVSQNATNNYLENANSIYLFRALGDRIKSKQLDYPVSLITTTDGISSYSTKIEYNFSTATIDPSGTVAQFREVTVIPGSNNASYRPSGYTTTLFYNGLTSTDDSSINYPVNLLWSGQPYSVNMYDKNNVLVSTTSNNFITFQKDFFNLDNQKIDVGYYSRILSTFSQVDNIPSRIFYTYNLAGQIRTEKIVYGVPNPKLNLLKDYIYWWEKYDPTNTRNLLSPVVQVIQSKSDDFELPLTYTGSVVNRWKDWTINSNQSIPSEFDTYVWKGVGSAPNTFSSWDVSVKPSSDWQLTNKVVLRDAATSTVLETIAKGEIKSSVVMDQSRTRAIAQIQNASYTNIAFSSFEQNQNGNWEGSLTQTLGNSKTGVYFNDLNATGLTKSGLSSTDKYLISFWAKTTNGSVMIDGIGTVALGNLTDWTYFEYIVTGLSSYGIRRSGTTAVQIDELRLHPINARMSTTTYDLQWGITSQTDSNNTTIYTAYDEFGRPKNILDQDRNIVKTQSFNFKKP